MKTCKSNDEPVNLTIIVIENSLQAFI